MESAQYYFGKQFENPKLDSILQLRLVPPISKLQNQGAISDSKWRRIIVIRKNKKKITGWFITPLKTGIQIDILLLVIILTNVVRKSLLLNVKSVRGPTSQKLVTPQG